ncbi:DNRLRE domain-containing protein [Sorangium sp. So ce1000]|uniref:DNRLRE domain-containing protein n=1 Tax=Sorangium sp. So ce1000 TaxID=3133325 RepID=UPI003F627876
MKVFNALCASVASALAIGCSADPGGAGGEDDESVGRAAQALSTEGQVCTTIQRGAGSAGVADVVLWQNAPTWNDGANVALSSGTSASGGLRRSLLRFDLSGLPSNAEVVSATLSLSQIYKTDTSTVRVHRVTSAWEESTATWGSFGESFDPAIVASIDGGGAAGVRTSEITALARAWASGEVENHGVLIEEDPVVKSEFRSSERPEIASRPKLDLCYVTCDDGIQNGSENGVDCGGPCPSCGGESFEGPPGGSPIDLEGTGATYPWSVGDIRQLPEPIARQGTHEPCTTGEDCQFDQRCEHPAKGECAHDPCATGTSLLSTCSGCVTKVCDANPNCCTQTAVPGDCGHDACQVAAGAATNMTTTCGDACIANICANHPRCCDITCTSSAQCAALIGTGSTCVFPGRCTLPSIGACPPGTVSLGTNRCTGTWSATCAGYVATECPGKTCAASTPVWDAACVGLTEQLCDTTCDTDPGCAHDKCYTGPRLSAGCDPCVAQVCASMPSCCSPGGAWTDACVDLVGSVCGETCPQRGLCEPFLPNETNPACSGVDLTVGVPCGGTIPVCNRGNTQAPAGIAIHRYPAGAGQLPSSAPSRILDACSPTGGTLACTTAAPIAPGECISVAGCTGVTDGVELVVNPPGAGQIAECQCGNNGSVYHSAECESPACTATASATRFRPVTLFVALDRSTSMRQTTTGVNVSMDRWIPATNALKAFFQDPASAGLGVAFRFWPHNNPGNCDGSSCPAGGGGCALPLVPFDGTAARRLSEDPAPWDQQESALVNAINSVAAPSGETPMYPALDGATTWAINYKNAHPDEEVAVVLITDGAPSDCDTIPSHIGNLARNAFENYGVRVHAVGFGNSGAELINLIAHQGGGQAFNLLAGSTLQGSLLSALASIRGETPACDVAVPPAGVADPASVSVVYAYGTGGETTLTHRAGPGSCGDGWYFADATNTSARLCPETCSALRGYPGGQLRATVPCVAESLSPITTGWERYHGACPPGTEARWEYLTYRTTTPGDSSVEFFVRSADDTADLGAAAVTLAAAARATPADTQVCDDTSTPPCAIDLGALPEAQADYLELQVTLNPTSDGAGGVQVQDWEIGYSCPDTE